MFQETVNPDFCGETIITIAVFMANLSDNKSNKYRRQVEREAPGTSQKPCSIFCAFSKKVGWPWFT